MGGGHIDCVFNDDIAQRFYKLITKEANMSEDENIFVHDNETVYLGFDEVKSAVDDGILNDGDILVEYERVGKVCVKTNEITLEEV